VSEKENIITIPPQQKHCHIGPQQSPHILFLASLYMDIATHRIRKTPAISITVIKFSMEIILLGITPTIYL
jgi:hypothetical protein